MFESFKNLFEKKIEISVKEEKQQEKEHVGIIVPHTNHTVFEIDNRTEKIQKALYVEKDIVLGSTEKPKKEVLVREGYSYVSALNKKNALKKYRKKNTGSKKTDGFIDLKLY